MKLKEAYRYQNFLDNLLTQAETLMVTDLCKKTTEFHQIHNAASWRGDEFKVLKPRYDYDVNKLIDLCVSLVEEKEKLSAAIAEAKKSAEINIDSCMAMNKVRQNFVSYLKMLDSTKTAEIDMAKTMNIVNKDGTAQIPISYNCNIKTEILFNRNDVRGLIRKYNKISDELSTKKDIIDVTVEVDIKPFYDLNDTIETLIS